MAMGLGFLGRESRATSTLAGAIHVLAAALGGALSGAAIGSIGELIGAGTGTSLAIVISAGVIALLLALRRQPMRLGRPCQVPKQWSRTMPVNRLYATWGLMLGSGVATLIPHSSHLLLLAAQFVAGPAFGAVSGALYGAAREAVALAGVPGELHPVQAMDALERWSGRARVVNILVVAVGAGTLVLALL
jgi:hypothetical protein